MRAHGRIFDSILDTVGNTPLVRVNALAADAGCRGAVLAKLEFFNPIGSVKDRIAVAMIEAMEAAGDITEGSTIVEPTAGNTGIGLAFVCAAKGLRSIFTMPEGFSQERIKLMRLLGAEVVLTPNEGGIAGAIQRANEIAADLPGAVTPWQYGNPANPDIHRRTTAEEIWRDTGGTVDAVVIGVGTGGTLSGVGAALKVLNPAIRIIAVEPELSAVISGETPFPHTIQGIGTGFIPDVLDLDVIDEVMTVSDRSAIETARQAARREGIPCGLSSGAALSCALRLAAREEMAQKTIVTVLPSFAERYQTTALFDCL
ncbi:MAG: cysteine synthase A [Pseudomonadota bacterium]